LTIANGKSFHTGDGGVRDGKFCPPVTRHSGAGGKRKKIVSALGVAGGIEGNGTQGTSLGRVSRFVVIKNLDVCTELDSHGVIVRAALAGNDGGRAEGARDAIQPRKLV
jgi:hypothetical protein